MKKYSFQRKMILINIGIIISVIMLLFVIAFFYLIEISNSNFEQQLQVRTNGFSTHIDSAIQTADEICLQLAANNYIIEEFQDIQKDPDADENENYFIRQPGAEARVKKFMTSYTLKRSSVSRICLFDQYQNFTFIGNAVDYGYLEKTNLDGHYMEDILGFFEQIQNTRLVKIYEQDPFFSGQEYILSVTREIKDYVLVPSEGIGFVQVHIPAKNMRSYFAALEFDGEAYLINEATGAVIFQYNESEEGLKTVMSLWDENELQDEILKVRGGTYVKSRELEELGLRVVMTEQNQDVKRYAITTFMWFLFLIICMITLVTAGQIQIIKRTTRPIIELCELVEGLDAEEQMLEIPMVEDVQSDELRNLNHAFNSLVKNLKLSMDHRLTSQVNELRAHMFALQSQMNPHFIHNILSIISAMSSEHEYHKIPLVCEQLSAMIRYTTTFNDSYIPVEEEIAHAVNYLELMKLRYEERFEYAISYASGDLSFRIPKFIFQPLIENCFQHGFKATEYPWIMELMFYSDAYRWELEIHDNGCGISDEKWKEMLDELSSIQKKDMKELVSELGIGGLSLKNIYARLWIAYGEEMIFERESGQENGCCIHIGGLIHDQSNGSGR